MEILVVGAGSVGRRHGKNLRSLGCRPGFVDPRADRLEEAKSENGAVALHHTLEQALAAQFYDGFVIASPPSLHIGQITQIRKSSDRWILCEKPLSTDSRGALAISSAAQRVLLGYTYRWWPPLTFLREKLRSGAVGAVRHARLVMSAHLADWHPWERYQDFFMASRELGGGALLDESHFVDLMLWLFGTPRSVFGRVERISSLEIDTDDNVDLLFSYEEGFRASIHLDLFGRPYERSITVIGEDGTVAWSYETNSVRTSKGLKWIEQKEFACERNDMFLGVAQELIELIQGARSSASCTYEDGLAVMQILDCCRESSAAGRSVEISQ